MAYIPTFISDESVNLIQTAGSADRTVFRIQCAEWWHKYGDPALAVKWKGRALESLRELEQAVTEMRKEVEALPDESTLHPVTLPDGEIVL